MPDKILVVDDNPDLLRGLQAYLELKGYQVVAAENGKVALRMVYAEHPDLVLLDIMMPVINGWQVCQRIREMSDVPIIMLTAKSEKVDIIKGLDMGADDYLTKPFDMDELVARVRVALRRKQPEIIIKEKRTYDDGYLFADLNERQITINDNSIKLSPTEYKLLALLLINRDRPVEYEYILEQIWGEDYITETDYVRTYIWHLRRKIEPDPKNPHYILSELDVGYRFVSHQ